MTGVCVVLSSGGPWSTAEVASAKGRWDGMSFAWIAIVSIFVGRGRLYILWLAHGLLKVSVAAMEIQDAYFLSQFPSRSELPRRRRDGIEWRKLFRRFVLVGWVLALLAVFGVWFAFGKWRQWHGELERARASVAQLNAEIERQQVLNAYSTAQALELADAMQKVVLSGSDPQQSFLAALVPEALKIQVTHGIPASATMAMAIYESGYGKSELALTANNFFGMKAFEQVWSGEKVYLPTKDSGRATMAYFRSYPSVAAAVQGYADFLKQERYREAHAHRNGRDFVAAVLRAGYCPDGNYLEHITEIIRRHKLDALDVARVPQAGPSGPLAMRGDG